MLPKPLPVQQFVQRLQYGVDIGLAEPPFA